MSSEWISLGRVGIVPKGEYSINIVYKRGDLVYYKGSSYIALKNNVVIAPVDDGINWTLSTKGYDEITASEVSINDTYNIIGNGNEYKEILQTFLDNIANKTKNNTANVTEISARLDNIIAHNNDTEGNTELIDIRTDVNGITHDSAGAAVRSQINELRNDLGNISEKTRNICNLSNVNIGYAWNNAKNKDRAILYIDVEPNTEYALTIANNSFDDIYYVEKEERESTTTLALTAINENKFVRTTNANCKVMGLQFNKTDVSKDDFNGVKIQIEKGNVCTEYINTITASDYELREKYTGYVSVKSFGASGNGIDDDSTSIQNAINYVRNKVIFSNDISVDNTIIIPGGVYVINKTIKVSPFVKLKTTGYVTFISNIENGSSMFWLCGESDDIKIYRNSTKAPWLVGDWINGESGLFLIGNETSNGIEIGSTNVTGEIDMISARYKLSNITIQGFTSGLVLNTNNMYLPTFNNIDLENNSVCVKIGDGIKNYNSGECITFNKCIFASSDIAFDLYSANMDLSLISCSADFCDVVFKDNNKGYHSILFVGGHIEGINIKNTENSGIVSGAFKQSTIIIRDISFTYSRYRNSIGIGFEGRLIINGVHERVPLFNNDSVNEFFNKYGAKNIFANNFGIQEKYHIFIGKNNSIYNSDFSEFTDTDFSNIRYGVTKKGFKINTFVNDGKCEILLSDDSPFGGKSIVNKPTIANRIYPYIETDFIEVRQNEEYFCCPAFKVTSGVDNFNPILMIAYFDQNKQEVSNFTNLYLYRNNTEMDVWSFNGGSYFKIPSNIKYVKIQFKCNGYPATINDYISFGGLFMERIN